MHHWFSTINDCCISPTWNRQMWTLHYCFGHTNIMLTSNMDYYGTCVLQCSAIGPFLSYSVIWSLFLHLLFLFLWIFILYPPDFHSPTEYKLIHLFISSRYHMWTSPQYPLSQVLTLPNIPVVPSQKLVPKRSIFCPPILTMLNKRKIKETPATIMQSPHCCSPFKCHHTPSPPFQSI